MSKKEKEEKSSGSSFRSQLKPTKIKSLRKRIDADDAMVGSSSNEYLNLEDGKTIKIRIFPAHPGGEDFYIPIKRYWLSFQTDDGEMKRGYVLDSRTHGGTKMDVVDEYVKYAKRKIGDDADKLEALVGTGPKANSLNPSYTWLCYAAKIVDGEALRAKLWEFKKSVRDLLNKLAMSEDDDEPIEVDPFTDVDEGLPISVTYNKNPNRKKGENYYDVVFPKKVKARPITDEEIEYFMTLKPLNEILSRYSMRDFEKALEGLQNFDEDNDIGLFDDDEWLEHLEAIKAQYDSEDEDDEDNKGRKSSKKKESRKAQKVEDADEEDNDDEDEEDDEEEDEEEEPKKGSEKNSKKGKKVEPEPDEDDEEDNDDEDDEEEDEEEGDEFDDMDRKALKKYVEKNGLDVTIKKSMDENEIREAIRKALKNSVEEDNDDEEDEEEDDDNGSVTLDQIRAKLSGKK